MLKQLNNSTTELKMVYTIMHLLLDGISTLIWAKNVDGQYSFINRSLMRLLGLSNPIEYEGKTIDDILLGDNKDIHESDNYVIEKRVTYSITERVNLNDGTSALIGVTKSPIMDGDKLIGIVGIGKDITQDIIQEEELERNLRAQIKVWNKKSAKQFKAIHEVMDDSNRMLAEMMAV